jgi:hypothetical protein
MTKMWPIGNGLGNGGGIMVFELVGWLLASAGGVVFVLMSIAGALYTSQKS